jgi:hypothetical protein
VRVLLAIIVAGCSFEHGEPQTGEGSGVVDPAAPDGSVPITVMCKYADSSLRLCVEFADGNYSTVTDGSQYHLFTLTNELVEVQRAGQKAAGTYWQSKLDIAEDPMLDITGAITFETFMAVPSLTGYHNAKLFYNRDQYELALDTEGRVSCRIGSLTARTETAIGRDVWRHIACVYDGQSLAVWLDGAPAKCQSGSVAIATSGTLGTRLVAPFIGFVDDMRIYARALAPTEVCSHADKTSCNSSCPE